MYEQFFGLQERPFDLAPNPKYLFLSAQHREALTHLRYGLTGRPGMTALIGEAGTGKTTLVRAAVRQAGGERAIIVHVSNPALTRAEFFHTLAAGFGFGASAAASKVDFLRALERALASAVEARTVLALIIDEAQSLPAELLEEVRLLTNLDVHGQSIAVALVGQPELAQRLNEAGMRQLKQRIALRCQLAPLTLLETAAYIEARVSVAGGDAHGMFTRDAVKTIHERSAGIPRTINVLCDNALVSGYAADAKPVDRDIVLEVCRDFDLAGEVQPVAAVPETPAAVSRRPRIADPRPLFDSIARPRRFSFF
jgi:general secretion pathway protein A